jgi:chromate reductase
MKQILCVNGSASEEGANYELLELIATSFAENYGFEVYNGLSQLPLFTPARLQAGIPESVHELKTRVAKADAVIISTPEYLHNIPAALKNALEWMTESGELSGKAVLPVTFTPQAPRGEFAMRSLLQSLKASKAKVIAELPIYQNELRGENGRIQLDEEFKLILKEALSLL